jgi:hypothetical protein
MAVLGVFFEHLYTAVNGAGKRDISIRDSSTAIPPSVAHLCSLQERSNDTRHVAAPAVDRGILTPRLIIHDKAGSGSRQKMRYRRKFQQTSGLRDGFFLRQRSGFTSTRPGHDPGCPHWVSRVQPSRQKPSPTRSDTRPAKPPSGHWISGSMKDCYPALNHAVCLDRFSADQLLS